MCKRDWHLWKFQTRFSDRTVSPSISATDRHEVQCELAFKQLGRFWDTLSNSLHLYHVAFRNWRVCLSSPLQALSRVTPSGLQSAVPRWDHPHASRADQPQPWSALRLLQQPLTMWNQPPQIKSKQETSSFLNAIKHTWVTQTREMDRFWFSFLLFAHTTHTLPYLHYSNRHLGTSVFARRSLARWEGRAGGVIIGHRCLGPSDTHLEERAILLPPKGLFSKQSVLAKAMYNGSDSATHSLLLQKITFTQLGMQLYW